ncbi:mitochondrial carrier [Ascobolus immersus RN42]|uniref:Mitochondrial carrier n=1 Tax=Ascobolus immersus RN42 TaxID=1160509 RepID=A0A3N4IT87_ASCIM|nr:mitochondrial carrier [Ascobolus immersus RN42]
MSPSPSNSTSSTLPRPVIESISGLTSGVLTTLITHPLDLIKTRLQLASNPTSSRPVQFGATWRVISEIRNTDGLSVRSLYRGISTNLAGNASGWMLYFLIYGEVKEVAAGWRGRGGTVVGGSTGSGLTSYDYLWTSGFAGAVTQIITNPIWVLKTRMLSTGANAVGAYKSTADGFRTLMRDEGVKGLYRGLIPSLWGVGHGALQFGIYENLKIWRKDQKDGEDLATLDWLVTSAGAKVAAGSIMYPYQVVRARLQSYDADKNYKNVRDVLRKVWRNEGFVGFYKGLTPNIVRVLPSTCITFLVYEHMRKYLS